MASNITYQLIDDGFPIRGTDNPSQGFRDNFGIIKQSLQDAKTEIEALQNNTFPEDISYFNNDAGYITADEVAGAINDLDKISTDSIETTATRLTDQASSVLVLSNAALINHYIPGQAIRIYGASQTNDTLDLRASVIPVKHGFENLDTGNVTFNYKVCQFNLSTGAVSSESVAREITGINIAKFNNINNISLSLTRSSNEFGILIYRNVSAGPATYNLMAVVGSKEFEGSNNATYIDYFDTDYTSWSKKSIARNDFDQSSGLIHFPLTAQSSPKRGWVDAIISSIDSNTGRITLSKSYFFDNSVIVSHDDTADIQSAIDRNVQNNKALVTLSDKTYIISRLAIPNNFALLGKSRKTTLKKLSWSSQIANNMLVSSRSASNITVSNLNIDGNMQNQFLINDTINDSANYIVDIPGLQNNITDIFIKNPIGGGIACINSSELRIINNKIENGGLTDRYDYTALTARESNQVSISNNTMKNFSGPVDVSSTNIGVLIGNTVNNCGEGILIVGSTKLISSPNLILGAAGEYIPGPDILNSEYDAINIVLENDTNFLSDVYVYQENGQPVDLSANRTTLAYKVNIIRLEDNIEELSANEVLDAAGDPIISPIINTDLSNGVFRFIISKDNVTYLKTAYSYSAIKTLDSKNVGLAYRVLATEYVPIAEISVDVPPVANVVLTPDGNQYLYTITVTGSPLLATGSVVQLLNHQSSPTLDNIKGNIYSIRPGLTNTTEITIEYPLNITSPGSGGQLTLENTYVLAKGRIL